MEFSKDRQLTFEDAVKLMFDTLGDWKIMALASSLNDHVTVRNVSCLFYNEKIYFKTDKNFRKTEQLLKNPHIAMCWSGIQIEGVARNCGLVSEEPNLCFQKRFDRFLKHSYNAYSHEDTEIIIEVAPKRVQVWDTNENQYARQISIDFENQAVKATPYDIMK